jgi:flagellum-specific ATP synthase
VTSREHRDIAAQARRHLATYEKARDLINIGAYVNGSDPEIDAALKVMPSLNTFLQQGTHDFTHYEETRDLLQRANIP